MSTNTQKSLHQKIEHESVNLDYQGRTIAQLPVLPADQGYSVIDIKALGQSGFYSFDPGFVSTASCESRITFIDGQKGQLLYRGYPIEQLAEQCEYWEVCYLLMNGQLPTMSEYEDFKSTVESYSVLPSYVEALLARLSKESKNTHPMSWLMTLISALSGDYYADFDINDPASRQRNALRLLAQMPLLVALCYRYANGLRGVQSCSSQDYAASFLHRLFADSDKSASATDEALINAMNMIFILHADHSQNASTSTLRLAGSTGANPYACVVAAIAALWGPAHGGANEACLTMLEAIDKVDHIGSYIERAKDPKDSFRLMGFGHRVYKTYDPRARLMRQVCHDVLKANNKNNEPLFRVAMALEKIALEDNYFKSRNLYPNVDFYSGITQNAIGIPKNLFTAIFALARTVGWLSHWLEMLSSPHFRLSRPRQFYTGSKPREVISLNQR